MDLGLKGRTAIVCGASSGLGLATAGALAGEGANVTMFARRRDVLQREADRIGALAVRGDVTNPRDLAAVVERTVEAFKTLVETTVRTPELLDRRLAHAEPV